MDRLKICEEIIIRNEDKLKIVKDFTIGLTEEEYKEILKQGDIDREMIDKFEKYSDRYKFKKCRISFLKYIGTKKLILTYSTFIISIDNEEAENLFYKIKDRNIKTITKVTNKEALNIINNRDRIGIFYTISNGYYVGIDNITGDAWTEDFNTLRSCKKWLRRG